MAMQQDPVSDNATRATHTALAVEGPGVAAHADYEDPHDHWAARDLLLSYVPFAVATTMRDTSLHGGLIYATVWSWLLLLQRFVFWDGKHKIIMPAVDIANCVLFPILLGFSYYDWNAIHKWYNVIAEGALAVTMLASVAAMKSFTGHYARYSKIDQGGRTLWNGDANWRKSCYHSGLANGVLFAIPTLLSLIPIETKHYTNASALNIIFNYVVPLVAAYLGIAYMHLLCGTRYERTSRQHRTVAGAATVGTGTAGQIPAPASPGEGTGFRYA